MSEEAEPTKLEAEPPTAAAANMDESVTKAEADQKTEDGAKEAVTAPAEEPAGQKTEGNENVEPETTIETSKEKSEDGGKAEPEGASETARNVEPGQKTEDDAKPGPEAELAAVTEKAPEQKTEDATMAQPDGAAEDANFDEPEVKTDSGDEESEPETKQRKENDAGGDDAKVESERKAGSQSRSGSRPRRSQSRPRGSRSRSQKAATKRDPEAPTEEEVDAFLKRNDVDERAASDLRDCPPEMQRKVIDRGDLNNARNSSAALIVRIRDARMDAKGAGGSSRALVTGLPSSKELNAFIEEHNVDETAAAALRSASPTMKRNVLNSPEFQNSTNVSALLLSRIKSKSTGAGPQAPWGGIGGSAAADAVRQALRDMGASGNKDVEEFIKKNDVDVQAAAQLRECSQDIQQVVIGRGALSGSHNPSSALIGRIREAKGIPEPPPQYPGYPPGYPMPYGYPPPGYPGYMGYPPPGYPVYPGYPPPGAYGYPPGAYGYPPPGPSEAPGPTAAPKAKARSGSYSYSSYSYSPSPSKSRRSPSKSRSRSHRKRSVSRGRKKPRGKLADIAAKRGKPGIKLKPNKDRREKSREKRDKSRRGRSRDRRR